jgi:hypothetical protein
MTRAVKVMVTMLANESLKKMTAPNMMIPPWKIDLKVQMRNVLAESTLPFYRVAYKGGNLRTDSTEQSSSSTSEKTGKEV